MKHIPVLLNEVLDFFSTTKSGIIIDATLGLGGHSYELLKRNRNISIIGFDKDIEALNFANDKLSEFKGRFELIHDSFCGISSILKKKENILGVLADIGVSSYQLDNINRGFGFKSSSLDMRMNLDSNITAKDIINSYTKDELNRVFRDYGEIANYDFLSTKIIHHRKMKAIETPQDFINLIPPSFNRSRNLHKATLVFQALRIEVNNELNELKLFLSKIQNLKNASLAIISFHSLEDRIIKNTFKQWTKNCICDKEALKCNCNAKPKGDIITKKPLKPNEDELIANNRARSAKMRCFRFYE